MKLKVSRKEFVKAIQIAQRAISPRSTIQILEGILLKAIDNQIILISSDTEMTIKTSISAIVMEEGEIVVNSRLFGDIIRKFQGETIDINLEGTSMNLKCEKSNFNIQCQLPDEYPMLPIVEKNNTFNISSQELSDAIKKTSFAVSMDETRMVFTGVLMDLSQSKINFVALDGFRMALKSVNKPNENMTSAIIPARTLNELTKVLEDEDVSVNISRNMALFKTTTTEVYTTLLSGEFFKYQGLITESHTTICTVQRANLQSALERASLLAKEDRANLVKFEIEDSYIKISSNSEIGNVEEIVESKVEGGSLKIAFNSKYLLDGIKIMESEEIKLYFTDSVNPCIIREDDEDYIYLVLPVRLAK
ncbi:DNA polymerase-3 subunit beta [Peptoniphilus asaccharolyticus DSM 20463]|uniref:Beta sliding clamp n=1 Tax=Peptoniphilus asaccharolyticus DSM 20463 TaxID=573058 RepID=A0A1W1V3L5_PEPAS|nr:DNA polymerase III subunit beta [Peptoniphilus asaccharolyticus]MBL7576248.1 DNA polymerase III subunit beta [Peptoniphilus asaccharolyticus]SMB87959.1 DNA polymerase-3 subunit beta [Peptoniphilus asaccharolyticus DSM 20463]